MIRTLCFFVTYLAAFFLISCSSQSSTPSDTQLSSASLICVGDSDCITGGCSGTVCQNKKEEPAITTCEWLPEYACFKTISCGCTGGKCQWKTDAAFDSCINEAQKPECTENSDCIIGGCSGTVCQNKKEEPAITTCEWLPEYACFKTISCGCTGGKCQWKTDAAFDKCVSEAK